MEIVFRIIRISDPSFNPLAIFQPEIQFLIQVFMGFHFLNCLRDDAISPGLIHNMVLVVSIEAIFKIKMVTIGTAMSGVEHLIPFYPQVIRKDIIS